MTGSEHGRPAPERAHPASPSDRRRAARPDGPGPRDDPPPSSPPAAGPRRPAAARPPDRAWSPAPASPARSTAPRPRRRTEDRKSVVEGEEGGVGGGAEAEEN